MKLNLRILMPIGLAVVASVVAIQFLRNRPPAQFGYALLGDSLRANFIVHGRDVYFDANDNQTAERSEKFSPTNNTFQVIAPDGTTRHQLTRAVVGLAPDSVSAQLPQHIKLEVNIHAVDQPEELLYQQVGQINVVTKPQSSGWAGFDRPMTFDFFDSSLKLPAAGGPSVDLRVSIGTLAKPDPDTNDGGGNLVQAVPGMLVPTATIVFPTTDPAEPIVKRYDLDQFC